MMKPLAALAFTLIIGCSERSEAEHSPAADELIRNARSPAERAELTRVRDEVDAAARAHIKELDAEIAELERENARFKE